MASSFAAGLLTALIFSLIFSSVAIAYFVTEMNISDCSNDKKCIVPHITLPDSLNSYNSEQDFLNGSFDIGTLTKVSSATWNYIEKVGYVLTGHSSGGENYFYIMNINPDSTKRILNNYKINNSPLNDYSIVVKGNAGISNNEIIVKSDGFHIPTYLITGNYFGERAFIRYPNANKIQNVLIQTEYYEKKFADAEDSILKFKFNGQEFTTTANKDDTISFLGGAQFYGGVNSKSLGFTLEYFKTGNTISGSGEQKDPLTLIADFITTVLAIMLWTLPESILPLTLNLLLIKTQLFGILVCIVVILRG